MNWPFLVASKLSAKEQKSFSKTIIALAIFAVAVSVAVMIISMATVSGFQEGIRSKVTGSSGHIVVEDIANVEGSEPAPMDSRYLNLGKEIKAVPGVKHVAVVSLRPCIAKGEEEIEGMVAKGVEPGYDFGFMHASLLRGKIPDLARDPDQAIISELTSQRLKLDTGDRITCIFFKTDTGGNRRASAINPRISGIYSTGIEEFDKLLLITDLGLLKKTMPPGTGFTQWEVNVQDLGQVDGVAENIYEKMPAGVFSVKTARQFNRQIFDWLEILNTNVFIIIALMVIVACINMSTALLILITERTPMIGILKAMGARNAGLRSIFIYQAMKITVYGLLLGNVIGLLFCWLQAKYGFITLDERTYYVNKVLIHVDPIHVLFINVCSVVVILLVLLIPSMLVSRLNPIRIMRFN